jgi:hypothetical protein|tara:strand:- start:6995 stop:7183 length:189 start_codon:yes stop_codon:yes gene_type:complete
MIDFRDNKKGYSAIIYVLESNNSVLVHFDGFTDILEAKMFSNHLMNDLGIEQLNIPVGETIH